jgi:hypothetical protein
VVAASSVSAALAVLAELEASAASEVSVALAASEVSVTLAASAVLEASAMLASLAGKP